jgi:hypothetical protein
VGFTEGVVTGIHAVEFSFCCDAETGFALGRGYTMSLIVVEEPEIMALAHHKAGHVMRPLVLCLLTLVLRP